MNLRYSIYLQQATTKKIHTESLKFKILWNLETTYDSGYSLLQPKKI